MAYQRDDIERVRAATDLVQLVEEVTTVKRRGRSAMAICPFHQEKTPSLSIDAARSLWYCFGCQASGDLFGFVQDSQGLTFTEALEQLARRAGIELRPDPKAARKRGEREPLVEAVERSVDFYHRRLLKAPDSGRARAYLRGRGYDAEIVERFQLGYAPGEWDALVSHLRAGGLSEKVVVGAGLAVRSRHGRLVDRFRGRLMFPIHDLRGDPVGFGGRLLEGEGAKYVNSPETRLYSKSRLLYGLQWAKADIVRAGYAVVVEGYTDVIALHQAGLPVAVATCGTALGAGHFDLLRRFTERVVLAFDADRAGAGASLRGFDLTVPGDLDLRVSLLPEGKDPADLVQAGEAAILRKLVEESVSLIQFRLEEELRRFNLDEPEARGRAVRATAPLVARHPDSLVRHEYGAFLSRRTGVELGAVLAAVEEAVRRAHRERPAQPLRPARPHLSGQQKAERELLRLLLANHAGLREIKVEAEFLTHEDHRRAFELLAPEILALPAGEPPDLGALLGEDRGEVAAMLRGLALEERPLEEPAELAARLQGWAFERRIEELRRALASLEAEGEPETHSELLAELVSLEQAKRRTAR
ncbi:MAG: DNA primase [Acidimicrobiia bacterium]